MVLVNSKVDSIEGRGCKSEKTVDSFNSLTKKAEHSQMEGIGEIDMTLGTTTRDKAYEISDEQMRKTWRKIHAPDGEERMNMTSQNRKNRSKKDLLAKMILFSIIIGQAFTKEIGGSLLENNILKENPPW